ncbi:hypothetical protein HAX54_005388 [Datura stramonium]|uniref:K Homology domain-containing protein n=1 Tax=Datura stramonium TaxID=4076 RepID=A0ABS8TB09_DATST|nr:hypothetical protein [Datura stramonium]
MKPEEENYRDLHTRQRVFDGREPIFADTLTIPYRYNDLSNYADNGRNKRRNTGSDKDPFSNGPGEAVYHYLCPWEKIGSIIGRGGENVKQLRVDTKSKIRIGETEPDCEERVVTIYSTIHENIVSATVNEDSEDAPQITIRLLVPSDQIGCFIGKRGQIVQNTRSESGARMPILKDKHLPACALSSDELLQLMG